MLYISGKGLYKSQVFRGVSDFWVANRVFAGRIMAKRASAGVELKSLFMFWSKY